MDAHRRSELKKRAQENSRPSFSPVAAAFLSLIAPGLGQMCQGRVWWGIAILVAAIAGYLLIVPGVIVHLFAVVDAARH